MKKYLLYIIFGAVFLGGFLLFLYPFISSLNNDLINEKLISRYNDLEEEFSSEEYQQMLKDAHTYNKYLHKKEKLNELGLKYESLLNPLGDGMMGTLEIPKIRVNLPIYHTLDEGNLQTGIGHKEDTALPVGGKGTHCVLAGHTGLPSAKLLTSIDRLKVDDLFYIHVLGEVLTYRVDSVSIVKPEETSGLRSYSNKDYVTIVTCTPYGINTHRLLVRGIRVNSGDLSASDAENVSNDITTVKPIYIITFSALVVLIICLIAKVVSHKLQKNKKKK